MIEPKVSLNLLVPSARRLSSQECEKNPKKSYSVYKLSVEYPKGKKKVKELLSVKLRNQKLISQNITMCDEAYNYMLATPASPNLIKVWKKLSLHEKLKHHFDQIAHDLRAVSYTYEVLND